MSSAAFDTFSFPRFEPHPLLRSAHAMTVAGHFWPRPTPPASVGRIFRVDEGTRVQALVDGPLDAEHDVLVLLHGLTGSATSRYLCGVASKALERGISCVRISSRNCGATEHLTNSGYHGGLTADLGAVVDEIVKVDGVRRIHIGGFSIGGNIAMKYVAELGETQPRAVASVCVVSPCVDFAASADVLQQGWWNRLYQRNFLRQLRRIIRRRNALAPDSVSVEGLDEVRSVRAFDDLFTAPLGGFAGVEDYYERASALPLLDRIRVPTLVLAARDDPLVPFRVFEAGVFRENPSLSVLASAHGGHTAFVARTAEAERGDRFWAENRLVQWVDHVRGAAEPHQGSASSRGD